MINMGALKMGLTEEELPDIVTKWREASPNIVNLWWELDGKVKSSVDLGTHEKFDHGIESWKTPALLHLKLPSGRCLRYFKPMLEPNRFNGVEITYQAYESGKWSRVGSYGPKLLENLTQGIARDCLVEAMKRVAKRYPDIVMHVHDEMIVEVPEAEGEEALKFICDCMGEPIPWAEGLLLRGDGYLTKYYRKD